MLLALIGQIKINSFDFIKFIVLACISLDLYLAVYLSARFKKSPDKSGLFCFLKSDKSSDTESTRCHFQPIFPFTLQIPNGLEHRNRASARRSQHGS